MGSDEGATAGDVGHEPDEVVAKPWLGDEHLAVDGVANMTPSVRMAPIRRLLFKQCRGSMRPHAEIMSTARQGNVRRVGALGARTIRP